MGCAEGGMNIKLHALCDSLGRPINPFAAAGHVGDRLGARGYAQIGLENH